MLWLSVAAGLDNPIVGVLKRDNCFVSNGGILHLKGITWYEVHTVNGEVRYLHKILWIINLKELLANNFRLIAALQKDNEVHTVNG